MVETILPKCRHILLRRWLQLLWLKKWKILDQHSLNKVGYVSHVSSRRTAQPVLSRAKLTCAFAYVIKFKVSIHRNNDATHDYRFGGKTFGSSHNKEINVVIAPILSHSFPFHCCTLRCQHQTSKGSRFKNIEVKL